MLEVRFMIYSLHDDHFTLLVSDIECHYICMRLQISNI